MKPHILSIACFVAAIATSQATESIYDGFAGTAGPLASSPSASLWTTLTGDTAALDGSGYLDQTGAGVTSEITSTTVFNITSVTKFQFKFGDIGSFYGGVAMLFNGAQGLYIRNDLAGFQLWAYDGVGHSAAAFTPVQGALWELRYDSSTKTASAYQNGSLVGSLTGIDFGGDTTAQFRSFQYGGPSIQTKFDYVATAVATDTPTSPAEAWAQKNNRDDFAGADGPLAESPSAPLWNTPSGDTAALDGSGNLVQTGVAPTSEITSTAEFNITSVTKFQFKLADFESFYGGVAMLFNGAQGLYIRNDLAGLQLWVYDGAGAHSAAAFTPVQDALWELRYDSSTKRASAFQNGSLVGTLTGIDFGGDTTAQFRSFQYGGAQVQTTFDYVAVATATDTPIYPDEAWAQKNNRDDFSGTAGPLASSPSASLWTTLSGDTAALDGSGNLVQTGAGVGSEITSTAEFNITSVTKFQFKLADVESFYGGVAMLFNGAQGLYIRNDLNDPVQYKLYVSDVNGAHSAVAFTPVQGALWELRYDSSTKTARAYQNGLLVGSLTGIDFGGDTTAKFRSFQYGDSDVQTTFDYVAVATATDTSPYDAWAQTNSGGQTANLDLDNDGVTNGVEFFMNSEAGFTANPGLVGNTVTWPNGGNIPSSAYGSQFVVQTSTDLVIWTDVPGTGDANLANTSGSVSYMVTGSGKQFVRLKVTPN
jgi:hypothetical protein